MESSGNGARAQLALALAECVVEASGAAVACFIFILLAKSPVGPFPFKFPPTLRCPSRDRRAASPLGVGCAPDRCPLPRKRLRLLSGSGPLWQGMWLGGLEACQR